jgi:hypothetical protein
METYADRSGSPDGIPWNQTRKEDNNVKHSNAMKLLMDKTCYLLLALVKS